MKKTALYLGPLLIILSQLFYSCSHTIVKGLSPFLSTPQIMFFRFFIGTLLLFPFYYFSRHNSPSSNFKLLIARSFFGVLAMMFYFLSLRYGDAGKASMLFQLSIIWTFLISTFFFKETAHLYSKIALPLSFIGLYLVLKPSHLHTLGLSEFYGILSSLFNIGVVFTLKELRKTNSAMTIVLIFYTFSFLFVSIPAFSTPFPPITNLMPFLFLMGLTGVIAQILMTIGFKYSPAWISSALGLIGIPIMYSFGILFFNEVVSISSFIGICIMLLSLIIITKKQ